LYFPFKIVHQIEEAVKPIAYSSVDIKRTGQDETQGRLCKMSGGCGVGPKLRNPWPLQPSSLLEKFDMSRTASFQEILIAGIRNGNKK
jgi:hypothetical protein